MDTLPQLAFYLAKYGYYAIFILVFLQQIGVPNPVTNELVLVFCGYLSYTKTLNIYEAIFAAIMADVAGSIIIFFAFYSFSKWLIDHSPRWLPLSGEWIEKIKNRVLSRGHYSIFISRMTPFLRGYISVAAGMLNLNRKAFTGTVIISAILWNGGLILIGRLIGPYWSEMSGAGGIIKNILILIAVLVAVIIIGKYFQKKQLEEK
ncbi:MAG: DedA family protein [Bacteroidia bacterium]